VVAGTDLSLEELQVKKQYDGPLFVVEILFSLDGLEGRELFLMPETDKEWTNIFQAGQIWAHFCRQARVPKGSLVHLKQLNMARLS
jgi:hypothetical protein